VLKGPTVPSSDPCEQYPFEMHMVHADDAGHLLVFGLLFQLSAQPSRFLQQFWKPRLPGVDEHRPLSSLDFDSLTSQLVTRSYLTYAGSLTTPPCTEGVRWVLADQAFSMSGSQMEQFLAVEGHDDCHHNCVVGNNRPVQPLYERTVYRAVVREPDAGVGASLGSVRKPLVPLAHVLGLGD